MKKLRKMLLLILFTFSIMIVGVFAAEKLDNDVRVAPDSDLTYYLDVTYDGVSSNKTQSSDSVAIDVHSKNIYVEDKIPEGLIFTGFVESSDGTFGAMSRDGKTRCAGYVLDDSNGVTDTNNYHGLHYDPKTRIVSFTVTNLQAGCQLTVGIKTKTPATVDDPSTDIVEQRRDFYNFATAVEGLLSKESNIVHVWMGSEEEKLYHVKYVYEGTVPENAPALPPTNSYVAGSKVGVEKDATLEGYVFSGWKSSDVTSNNGNFIMPFKDITFVGSFTALPKYEVRYQIKGEAPEGYVPPKTKSYNEGETVDVDSLKPGDVVNGYIFKGWTTSDVTVENDTFKMPNKDVVLTGVFEPIVYKVEYRYQGVDIPEGAEALLPKTKTYKAGERVKREPDVSFAGYEFLGWYKEESFIMPEEDVIIYGEWKLNAGKFVPEIEKTIENEKAMYYSGEIVTFEIAITNPEAFAIHDVMVSENNERAYFVEGEAYEVLSQRMARINSIEAGETVIVKAQYQVTDEDLGTIVNEAEIIGALADQNYTLDTDKEYKDSVEFKVGKPSLPNTGDNIVKYVIMCVVSIILIVGAGILLITKKKQNN